MAISGLIGAGAADGLEELLAQRLLQQEAEARRVNEAFTRQIAQRRTDEDRRQFDVSTAQRERFEASENERADRVRRDRNDAAGVQEMLVQRQIMNEEAPKPPKLRAVTVRGPKGQPVNMMVPEDAAVEEWRAPQQPSTEGRQWVERGGRVLYDVPRPGDTPHVKRDTGMTEGERQRAARAKAAQSFLTRLDELRRKINTKMGPQQGVGGVVRRGAANMGLDPDVAQYERERAAAGRALAVAVMGAQNLSDGDANAWYYMLPDATTDEETAQRLINSVQDTLNTLTGQSGEGSASQQSGPPAMVPSHEGAGAAPKRLRFDAKGNPIP